MTTRESRAYTQGVVRSTEEEEILECVRTVQRDGSGYGSVIVTVKEGRIVTVRREHIQQVKGQKTNTS